MASLFFFSILRATWATFSNFISPIVVVALTSGVEDGTTNWVDVHVIGTYT